MSPSKKLPLHLLDCPNCGQQPEADNVIGLLMEREAVWCACGMRGPLAPRSEFGNKARDYWNRCIRRGAKIRKKNQP